MRSSDRSRDAETASPFWSQPLLALRLAGLWLLLLVIFNGVPDLDRFSSDAFFTRMACPEGSAGVICGDFMARLDAILPMVRRVFHYLPAFVALMLVAMLARACAKRRGAVPSARLTACALAAFALGPGLLVNGFLKEFWGRPRPVATDLFGGQLPFVPAGEWSRACVSNCSFVSGEASTVAWLICLAPLLPQPWRKTGFIAAVAAAVFASLLRVAFGGHYLSDVVLGGLSTLVIFAAVLRFVEWNVSQAGRAACGDAAS